VILGSLALFGIMEVPTGDMTMADVAGNNNKDMGMDMEISDGMDMGMEMNMDMKDDMVMK
jgi:hypothetical protein